MIITLNKKNQFAHVPVDFKLIYKINEKLKFPKEDPLWYIYHIDSKSSFGPISTKSLEVIYNKKNIDGASDVRFIDVFKIKGKGAFAYFKLKDLENPNYLMNNIEGSSLYKYVDELNKYKKDENLKNEVKIINKPTNVQTNQNRTGNAPKVKQKNRYFELDDIVNEPVEVIILSSDEDIKKKNVQIKPVIPSNNNNNFYNKSINKNANKNIKKPLIDKNIPNPKNMVHVNQNIPSVIDEEYKNQDEKNYNDTNQAAKKKGKKPKGKPVDLDVKTGFFTLSQQEKNYEPMFVCGDKEN